MRAFVIVAILSLLPAFSHAADKLTFEDRIELTRGLMAEYATAKILVPHSKKALEFNADGTWDKQRWAEIARTSGPAARVGDMVQITKMDIGEDRLVLQLNGGYKGGRHWYEGIQMAGGMGGPDMTPVPISQGSGSNAPAGTSIVILFHKPLEPIKAAAIKKMLAPVLDFEKRSATEVYAETIPPEMKKAIQDKRVVVGMDRDQVLMAMGHPAHKSRETDKDGGETEDWVFGKPPGRITFVTFSGDKVIKVKEAYAGLGTQVADPPVVR